MSTKIVRSMEVTIDPEMLVGNPSLKATDELDRATTDQGGELAQDSADNTGSLEISTIAAQGGVESYIDQIKRDSECRHVAYREAQYDGYAKCCLVTELLQTDDAEWTAFCSHQIWKDNPRQAPKGADRSNALRFVLLRAITGVERAGAQQASKISRALIPLMQSGAAPCQIKQLIIAEGGLERLAVKHANRRVNHTGSKPDAKLIEPQRHAVSVLGQDPFVGYSVGTMLNAVIIIRDRYKGTSSIDIESIQPSVLH